MFHQYDTEEAAQADLDTINAHKGYPNEIALGWDEARIGSSGKWIISCPGADICPACQQEHENEE